MRLHLVSILIFISYVALAQDSTFINSWNYFDKDSVYYEVTITNKYIYVYEDYSDVKRFKVKLSKSSLSFKDQKWTVLRENGNTLEVLKNGSEVHLFKLSSIGNELIKFYDWYNAKDRNGNGATIFWNAASGRRNQLVEKAKKGL